MARGKRYREAHEKIDRTRAYPPGEAISMLEADGRRQFR